MSPGIMMEVDDKRILDEAHLLVLRSIQDAVKRIDSNLGEVRGQVQEVRERMIAVELSDTKANVTKLEGRMDLLEKEVDILDRDKARVQGAAGVVGWLGNNYQALGTLAVAIYLMLKSQHGLP